ncbi:MAG: heme o synthase [Thermoprotei archaeon]
MNKSLLLDYYKLAKPGIVFLLVLVSVAAYISSLKNLELNDIPKLGVLVSSGVLSSSGSAMLNNYLDRKIDRIMKRTMKRPLAAGRVKARSVLITGILLTMLSLIIAYIWFGFMTSIFIALGALTYLYVYTILLKRRTPLNIVIGGFAGSFAALTGSSAAGSITLNAIILALLVFIWTPGHFWSLALKFKEDYLNAKIPMLPVVYSTETTVKAITLSNILTSVFSLLIYPLMPNNIIYLTSAIILAIYVIYLSMKFIKQPTQTNSIKLFKTSNLHLTILCSALIVGTIITEIIHIY